MKNNDKLKFRTETLYWLNFSYRIRKKKRLNNITSANILIFTLITDPIQKSIPLLIIINLNIIIINNKK